MSREEEIKNEAELKRYDIASEVDYMPSAAYDGFVMGAEWADRTMLARICEWLENHDMTEHIGVIYSGTCSINFDNQGLIDVLCKAMEE